jgi:hypothetical protein
VTNAVVCWHTEYMGLAVAELRGAGREVDAEVLAHISPARSSVVNYYGSITVDYERELAQLDDRGHRPLRSVDSDETGAGPMVLDTLAPEGLGDFGAELQDTRQHRPR